MTEISDRIENMANETGLEMANKIYGYFYCILYPLLYIFYILMLLALIFNRKVTPFDTSYFRIIVLIGSFWQFFAY